MEHKSDFALRKDTPYLTLMGNEDLWSVFWEYFKENWPRYNGTPLYYTVEGIPVAQSRTDSGPASPFQGGMVKN